ncbi:signal peptidase II [Maritimibacter sp. 55A14]|uniref:signal peptidase II n=1 Tax=Maritimibacter sp. 55A14 TaxID=2174844 RepID=UPI000D609262|nr:signal peptidase II [Maritimibacter sp. 55A14]PWE29394.1 signal peptidase II [Maritimibacter sp. 55A14]
MRWFWITAISTFALDQFSKLAVVHWLGLRHVLAIDVIPPLLNFRMGWNRGVNFGLFANNAEVMRWVLTGLAVAVSLGLVWWAARHLRRPLHRALAGAVLGGALGNALDRVLYGAVADFLNMSCCGIDNPYAFNIADVAIFGGAIGLVVLGASHDGGAEKNG